MATSKKRTSSKWIWLTAAIALIVLFYLIHLATRTRIPVRVAIVERTELRSTIPTNGKVEPQVNFEAHAPYAGLIKALYVHEGQHVVEGTLLLSMDDTDAKARLATARASLQNAQTSYSAMMRGGTQEERLSLQGDLAKAQIDRDQAQHDLDALQELAAHRRCLGKRSRKCPRAVEHKQRIARHSRAAQDESLRRRRPCPCQGCNGRCAGRICSLRRRA